MKSGEVRVNKSIEYVPIESYTPKRLPLGRYAQNSISSPSFPLRYHNSPLVSSKTPLECGHDTYTSQTFVAIMFFLLHAILRFHYSVVASMLLVSRRLLAQRSRRSSMSASCLRSSGRARGSFDAEAVRPVAALPSACSRAGCRGEALLSLWRLRRTAWSSRHRWRRGRASACLRRIARRADSELHHIDRCACYRVERGGACGSSPWREPM